jgi:DNA segregation ATPase FtsK/SpoIIIE-like protein
MTLLAPTVTEPETSNWVDALTPVEAADFGELFLQAIDVFHRDGRVSVVALQQNLGVNAGRAARIYDAMERLGLVAEVRPRRRAAARQPIPA